MSTAVAADVGHRRRMLRRLAQSCLVVVILVVVLSAFMRHRLAGVGCEDWPACQGQQDERGQAAAAGPGDDVVALARLAHRAVASLALVLVVAMLLGSLAMRPVLRAEGAAAAGLLVLALGLAVLGVAGAGSRAPAVMLGNLVGGFAMLALSVRMVSITGRACGRPPDSRLARPAIAAVLLLLLQIGLGAVSSASHAMPEAPVHLLHRLGAIVAAVAVLALVRLAWRHGRRHSALALAGLLLLVVGLGLAIGPGAPLLGLAVGTGAPSLAMVLLHNLGAAGLLAIALRLA